MATDSLNSQQPIPTDKNFSITFAVIFLVLTGLQFYRHHSLPIELLSISCVFFLISLTYPKLVRPLNITWMKFGNVLQKMMTPIIMGLIYFVIITPIGLMMKLLRKRLLDISFEKKQPSYWVNTRLTDKKNIDMTLQF